MYVLYVVGFAIFIAVAGLASNKWNSPVAVSNMPSNTAKEVAENIYNNASIVKQWAESQSITSQIVNTAALSAYRTYSLMNKGDYQAVIVTDSQQNTYEIYSWNRIYDQRTTLSNVVGQLVNLTSQIRGGYATTWFIPLVVINTNCSPNIMNSFLAPIKKNLNGYNTLFTTLCNQAGTLGAPVAQYALVIQLY